MAINYKAYVDANGDILKLLEGSPDELVYALDPNVTRIPALDSITSNDGLINQSVVPDHTHVASEIIDFDTAVTANTAVAANTAKRSYPIADENKLATIEPNAKDDQNAAEVPVDTTGTQFTATNLQDFVTQIDALVAPGGGLDHGGLVGLADDDHTQYHNDARGDIRYYTKALLDGGQLDNRYYTETELNAGQLNNLYYTETELDNGALDTRYYTKALLDSGQLDNRYYTETELSVNGVLDARYYTETELNAGQLNNLYYTETELDGGQLDNRYFTETELLTGSLDSRYYTETEVNTLLNNYQLLSQKNQANGYVGLDANSKINPIYLPPTAISETFVVADIPARNALTIGAGSGEVSQGDYVIVTDASADPNVNSGGATYVWDGAAYQRFLTADSPVQSVNGLTGNVVLTTSNIAEGTNLYYTETRVTNNASVVLNTTHRGLTNNPHGTTAAQVGAYTTAQTDTQISNAISTHLAAGDPHPQYETSAEAQAKVDAHANLTNNPHAVTKVQVGLGNVDNTSDLNKPISTATQNALNLKYDASNPAGYVNAAQAAAAAPVQSVNGETGVLTNYAKVNIANIFTQNQTINRTGASGTHTIISSNNSAYTNYRSNNTNNWSAGAVNGANVYRIASGVGIASNIQMAINPGTSVDFVNKRLINLVDPTGAQDAATKNYVDTINATQDAAIALNTAKVSAAGSIDTHSDVDTTTAAPVAGSLLQWNGTVWQPAEINNGFTVFPIWAEENGALSNNKEQWSFGNGAVGTIGIPMGIDCEVFCLTFQAETFGTSASIDLMRNGVLATTVNFTSNNQVINIPSELFNAGDLLSFRTNTVVGTMKDVRVAAWVRVSATVNFPTPDRSVVNNTNVSFTSTTFANIPGMSTTISLTDTGSVDGTFYYSALRAGGANANVQFRVVINGNNGTAFLDTLSTFNDTGAVAHFVQNLPSGTYTVSVQALVDQPITITGCQLTTVGVEN
jgi:hypothetical protein